MRIESGQVAVVTGAAHGIGYALAAALGARGAVVVLADVDAAAVATASARLSAAGVRASGVPVDVASAASVQDLAAASVACLVPSPTMTPYTAVKHAVVAITEALDAELRSAGAGLGATVLCPGWVDTDLYRTSAAGAPPGAQAADERPVPERAGAATVQTPMQVAAAALAGIEAGRRYVVPNPDGLDRIRGRWGSVLADLPAAETEGKPSTWR